MKTQPFQFSIGLIASALICVAILCPCEGLQAQTTVTSVKDITVPANKTVLHFTLRGGDGGKTDKSIGGVGATVMGYVNVGTALNEIAPGSTLRIIPGQAGENNGSGGGGGGGGTALAYQKTDNSDWVILAVAGGGGGASIERQYAGFFGIIERTGYDGGPGKTSAQGTGSDKNYPGYSGGGAFGGTQQACGGKRGMKSGTTPRSAPGGSGCISDGGAGFGSGGAVLKDGNLDDGAMYYGGGGGGYSGGGVSKSDNGGGSWANINFVSNAKATSNGLTGDPQDGYVTYKFQ